INKTRSRPGCFCRAYRIGFKPRTGGDMSITDRAAFSGLVRWKFFIHVLFARGWAGLRALLGCTLSFDTLGGGWQAVTVTYRWPKRTAMDASSRISTRTSAPRRPARISLRAIL